MLVNHQVICKSSERFTAEPSLQPVERTSYERLLVKKKKKTYGQQADAKKLEMGHPVGIERILGNRSVGD